MALLKGSRFSVRMAYIRHTENQSNGRARGCDHAQIFCAHGLFHAHGKSKVIGVRMAMCTSGPIIGKDAPWFLDCKSTLPKKCRQIYPLPPRNSYLRATPPCHHYAQEVWRLLEYIIVKMGWYFNVRKTGTQLPKAPSNLPSAAGKRLLWGNTPVPVLCTRASQLLTLECTINSIEIGWYLMSRTRLSSYIFNITHWCHVCSLHSSAPNKRCLHHNLMKNNFSAAVGAHHLKCHLQPYLPNLIWKFHCSSHLGSYCRWLSIIIPRRNSSVWILFYDVVKAQTWRKWEYLLSDAGS